MQAVILAGGKGTRLVPFTHVFPKPLVPLGEKPILDTILRQLKHFGFTQVTLAVGYMAEMIQTYVNHGTRYGLDITYSLEEEPLGTVGPLAQMAHLAERFLVMNGDVITNLDYGDLVTFHRQHQGLITIGTYKKPFKNDLGIINHAVNNSITDYIEKPVHVFQVEIHILCWCTRSRVLGVCQLDRRQHPAQIDFAAVWQLRDVRGGMGAERSQGLFVFS